MRYEYQYYLLFLPDEPGIPELQPVRSTMRRFYQSERLVPGKPLRFVNGLADWLEPGVEEQIGELLFEGDSFGIHDRFREPIEAFNIEGLQLYAMPYTDSANRTHSEFWYLYAYLERDFLDVDASELYSDDEGDDPDVLRFAFNRAAMEAVEQHKRLIFQLGGVANGSPLFFHQRVLDVLIQGNAAGFRYFRVSEYEDGMEA